MKKIIKVIISLFVVISLTGCQKEDKSDEFASFIQDYLVDEMSNDYSSMHIFFEHPEKYGIDVSKVKVSLGEEINEETIKKDKQKLQKLKEEFEQFDRDTLNEEQRKIYDAFSMDLQQTLALSQDKYDYLGTVFESDVGIHVNIPMLFTDWVLRNEQDVKDLITLVKDVKPYVNSLLDYTKTQAKKGYLMIDIDNVVKYCDQFVKSGKNNSTLISMKENIDSLSLSNGEDYKKQLEEAFMTSFIPAYQNISSTLNDLKSSKNNSEGLVKLKNGKEYYEDLMKSKIGTNKSVSDVKEMMNEASSKYLMNMQKIYMKNPNVFDDLDHIQTNYSSYEEIMKDLNQNIKNDFPEVGNLDYNIKNVNEEIASRGIAAYFMIPAIDGTTPKQIRVNTNKNTRNIKDIDTYSTTAHEGLPGHMYMYAYTYANCDNLYNKLESTDAFQEGYATYVELYSYKYLKNLDQDALEVLKYNQMYTFCMIVLADIGIHYEGWSIDDLKNFFEEKGLSSSDGESIQKSYNQLQANPGVFLPYYVGMVEIENMKEEAQDKLKDKFNDKEFHKALIENGSTYFDIVEESIDKYIDETK